MENEISEEYPDSREDWTQNRHDTKAITLRLKKSWIAKLDKLAFRVSDYYGVKVSKQWLIQESIRRMIIQYPFSELMKQFHILSDQEQFKQCKRALKLHSRE